VLSIAGPRSGQLLSRITDSQVKLLCGEYSGAQGWSAALQDHRWPGSYSVLSIAGPKAGQLLSRITDSQVKLLSAKYSGAQVWSATLQDHR
jgi:hypothetical protein